MPFSLNFSQTAFVFLFALGLPFCGRADPRTSPAATPPAPSTVALLKTQSASPLLERQITDFDALLLAELSSQSGLLLVEREEIGTVLEELRLSITAATSASSAARIGRWTGAKIIISASGVAAGRGLNVAARVMGAETGRVIVVSTATTSPDHLASGAHELAGKIAALLSEKRDELLPPPDDETARLDQLRKLLQNRTPPAVTLAITEKRGTSRSAPRSITASEIERTWQAVGGKVLRDGVPPSGTLALRGEAHATPGLRRGDFFSARAVITLIVSDAASGRELRRERQTEIAVDFSERSASDAALQKAGGALADRLALTLSSGTQP